MAVQLVHTSTFMFYDHSMAFPLESCTSGQVSTSQYKGVQVGLYAVHTEKHTRICKLPLVVLVVFLVLVVLRLCSIEPLCSIE